MCFQNVIGIRSNCLPDENPESGLYINQAPGISLKIAGDIADDEYRNGYQLLKDLRTFSAAQVVNEFGNKVMNHLRIAPLLELTHSGFWVEDEWLPITSASGGIEIKVRQNTLARVHIYKLNLLTNSTVTGQQISITDLNGTTTYDVDLEAGVVYELAINAYFTGPTIFIYWDLSGVEVNDSNLYEQSAVGTSCGVQVCNDPINYLYANVRGRKDVSGSPVYSSRTYGITVDFDIACDIELLLCKMKHLLYQPLFYKYAACFMEERINSTRFNAITGLMKEEAEKGLIVFQGKYDALLDSFAKEAARFITRMNDDCVSCGGSRRVTAYV